MGFFGREVAESGGISRNFYQNRAIAVLSELSDWNFAYVDIDAARFYSEVYAEARRRDASAKADLSTTPSEKSLWRAESQRWNEALSRASDSDFTHLSSRLDDESISFFKKAHGAPEMADYGTVLQNLSDMLATQ